MSARTGDWELLGYDGDPVPGDPDAIADEGAHYSGVATTIEDQIARLRQLANPDERLKGQYADELVDCCNDAVGDLEKVQGRFEKTGAALTSYADDVRTARTATWNALVDADHAAAARKKDADAAPHIPGTRPTDEAGGKAWDDAHKAMSVFDGAAESTASTIRSASDDDMKDSRWDKFKNWVHGFAGVLDFLCDLAGILAAIIMVVCIFIPGPGWLVALALGATIFALAGHSLLAATGNGSWLDVAFDAVSLVTMGMGGRALKLAASSRTALLAEVGAREGGAAATAAFNQGLLNGGRGLLGELHTIARLGNPAAWIRTVRAGRAAEEAWTLRELPEASRLSRLMTFGDDDLASHLQELRLLTGELGDEAGLTQYAANLRSALKWTVTSNVVGLSTMAMNPKLGPNIQAWDLPVHKWLSQHLTFDIG